MAKIDREGCLTAQQRLCSACYKSKETSRVSAGKKTPRTGRHKLLVDESSRSSSPLVVLLELVTGGGVGGVGAGVVIRAPVVQVAEAVL